MSCANVVAGKGAHTDSLGKQSFVLSLTGLEAVEDKSWRNQMMEKGVKRESTG